MSGIACITELDGDVSTHLMQSYYAFWIMVRPSEISEPLLLGFTFESSGTVMFCFFGVGGGVQSPSSRTK
jgi:hypothetical protein